MRILYTFLFLCFSVLCTAQIKNTDGSLKYEACHEDNYKYWKILYKVKYTSHYDAEVGEVFYTPHFTDAIKELEHQEIIISGYLFEEGEDIFLSAYPSPYSCWGGGFSLESVIGFDSK
jgi:hypothetical protein